MALLVSHSFFIHGATEQRTTAVFLSSLHSQQLLWFPRSLYCYSLEESPACGRWKLFKCKPYYTVARLFKHKTDYILAHWLLLASVWNYGYLCVWNYFYICLIGFSICYYWYEVIYIKHMYCLIKRPLKHYKNSILQDLKNTGRNPVWSRLIEFCFDRYLCYCSVCFFVMTS